MNFVWILKYASIVTSPEWGIENSTILKYVNIKKISDNGLIIDLSINTIIQIFQTVENIQILNKQK